MKRFLCFMAVFAFLQTLSAPSAVAQDLSGIWKGYFIAEDGSQYKLEFQVSQSSSLAVTGVSYSYLDTRFYGKATMTGRFAKNTNSFSIQELRTVEVKQAGGSTCLMNYKLTYSQSGREQYLEGRYVGKREDRVNPANNGTWGDCGGGTVFLRRVENSDFYVEPFIRKNDVVVNTPPKTVTKAPVKKPPVVASRPPVKPKAEVKKETVITRPTRSLPEPEQKEVVKKVIPKMIPVPVQTRSRKNDLAQTLVVTHEEVTIKLYDNGEVDDDTVSIYLDDKVLLSNKRLSAVPIEFKVKLDESIPEHTLIMVAENMGRIPPNTSLLVVFDGEKRYQVNITSTDQKNAMVRFRYQKPTP